MITVRIRFCFYHLQSDYVYVLANGEDDRKILYRFRLGEALQGQYQSDMVNLPEELHEQGFALATDYDKASRFLYITRINKKQVKLFRWRLTSEDIKYEGVYELVDTDVSQIDDNDKVVLEQIGNSYSDDRIVKVQNGCLFLARRSQSWTRGHSKP